MKTHKPPGPGPLAARVAAIENEREACADPVKKSALTDELWSSVAVIFDEPVPEEDAEATARMRKGFGRFGRKMLGRVACVAYSESAGVPARRDPNWDAWPAFAERVGRATEGEPEEETLAAAIDAFAKSAEISPPPPSEHWLAALRQIRTTLAKEPSLAIAVKW